MQHSKVQSEQITGLQGELIAAIAEEMGDPDRPARQWLRQGTVPLGISEAIEPGGVFPQADESTPDGDECNAFQESN